jgi:hypothetical protein
LSLRSRHAAGFHVTSTLERTKAVNRTAFMTECF